MKKAVSPPGDGLLTKSEETQENQRIFKDLRGKLKFHAGNSQKTLKNLDKRENLTEKTEKSIDKAFAFYYSTLVCFIIASDTWRLCRALKSLSAAFSMSLHTAVAAQAV